MSRKVTCLLIALLVTSISGCDDKKTGSQIQWGTYEDPQGKFSIEYPKDWKVEAETGAVEFENPSKTVWFMISLAPISQTPTEVNLKGLLFSIEGYLKADYPSQKPVSEPQEIQISGYSALKRTYEAEVKGAPTKTIVAVTAIDGTSFMFLLVCAPSEFSQNEQIFNQMILSFSSPAVAPKLSGIQATKSQPTTLSVIEEKRLTTRPATDERPAWSPDGKRIVFTSYQSYPNNGDIWVMDNDGGNQKQLTNQELDSFPTWSPDGKRIAFSSLRSSNADIWVMDSDGGNQKQLIDNPSYEESPSWSPDGTKIAFVSNRSGNFDIWVMGVNGQNEAQLTTDVEDDYVYPQSWSPDRKKIVFTSYRSGNGDIWVMDNDGGNKKQLTKDTAWDGRPAWSPDGKRIAFSSYRSSNNDIWVMDTDGSNQKQLVASQDSDNNPSWSPDGKKIVYVLCKDSGCDIWIATLTEIPFEPSLTPVQTLAKMKKESPNLTVVPARSPKLSIDYRYVGDSSTIECDTYPPAFLVEEALGAREAVGADAYVKFNNVGGPGKIKIETTFETTYGKVLSSKSSELDIDGNKQYVIRIKIYYRLSEASMSGKYYLKINSPSGLKVNYEVKSPYGGYDMDLPEIEDITICYERDFRR